MSLRALTVFFWVLGFGLARAGVPPVEISVAESTAWTGERVPIRIELRAPGSFSGSAAFDLPEIPGTLLMKVGNPVVSSKEIEGESWFVQTHKFALFSQKIGTVTIPSFPVRFEAREGFTGDAIPVVAKTESVSIEIQRPPGSEGIPFLVTTGKLEITETWDPDPGSASGFKVGDIFRRTIVQRSRGLTGMALIPASTSAPEGVRVYEPQVETSDNTERGAFDGERRETLTYLLQEPGLLTLPALEYTWWNPGTETLESRVLPEVAIFVAASPVTRGQESAAVGRRYWLWVAGVGLAALLLWKRHLLLAIGSRVRRFLDHPEKQVARELRRACRRNDAGAAIEAWGRWRLVHGNDFRPSEDLRTAVREMHRVVYGSDAGGTWNGSAFWQTFKQYRVPCRSDQPASSSSNLPPLNPPATVRADRPT